MLFPASAREAGSYELDGSVESVGVWNAILLTAAGRPARERVRPPSSDPRAFRVASSEFTYTVRGRQIGRESGCWG
ncbi:hypothetical protein TRAPUB_11775 [Trametes pubescens]|uniref:Uncharacterized protein n=1 Tax=Trametes pubescens TaxID=154538 RepID=A0A1M2VVU4_TRAPU|nr:hypothetical protein TRAPUB_11775 [Trametes pubescens]